MSFYNENGKEAVESINGLTGEITLTPGLNITFDTLGNDITINASGAISSLSFEVPVGVINGVNDTFTVSNIPIYIALNGLEYFEGDGYTRVGLTITMLVIPETGSTLKSAY